MRSVLATMIGIILICASWMGVAAADGTVGAARDYSERIRTIEAEISQLESRLKKAQADSVSISKRLERIEAKIVTSYMEIDEAELELKDAKQNFNDRIRFLYCKSRINDLVKVLESDDVTEFIDGFHSLAFIADEDADAIAEVEEKKERLEREQNRLIEYKQQSLDLMRQNDAKGIEVELFRKRQELGRLQGEMMALQYFTPSSSETRTFHPRRTYNRPAEENFTSTGENFSGYSSWYGNEFHGRGTANGEVYDQYAFTCAHRTLPFGTWLRVTFRGRSVIVRVNDRGPFIKGRILDLSRGAAESIGLTGVQWVDCEIMVPNS